MACPATLVSARLGVGASLACPYNGTDDEVDEHDGDDRDKEPLEPAHRSGKCPEREQGDHPGHPDAPPATLFGGSSLLRRRNSTPRIVPRAALAHAALNQSRHGAA